MKKLLLALPAIAVVCAFAFLQTGLSGCTKEVIVRDTVTVTVIQKDTIIYRDTVSLTFQPCDNPTETVLASNFSSSNAMLKELPSGYWTAGGNNAEIRSLLKFNLSPVQSNRTILSAQLSLYAVPDPINGNLVQAHSGNNNAILIQRITSDWSVATLTWSNQPQTTTQNQVELAHTSEHFKNYANVDVTSMVRAMYTTGNYGMLLRLKNLDLYNIQNFASSKHVNAALRPKLVVTYTKP